MNRLLPVPVPVAVPVAVTVTGETLRFLAAPRLYSMIYSRMFRTLYRKNKVLGVRLDFNNNIIIASAVSEHEYGFCNISRRMTSSSPGPGKVERSVTATEPHLTKNQFPISRHWNASNFARRYQSTFKRRIEYWLQRVLGLKGPREVGLGTRNSRTFRRIYYYVV